MPSQLTRIEFRLNGALPKEYLLEASKKYDMNVSEFINFLLLQHYKRFNKVNKKI